MKKSLIALSLLLITVAACDKNPTAGTEGPVLKVMTRNLYVGGDIEGILAATDPTQIPLLTAQTWGAVQATDYGERVKRLAFEIYAFSPDVVALQEVSLFRGQSPSDFLSGNPVAASDVLLDFQGSLLAELAALGADYSAAAVTEDFDIEVPMATSPTSLDDIRLTDHETILVRKGVEWSNPQGGNFAVNVEVPLAGSTISVTRGWASVDIAQGGHTVRFFATHLETAETSAVVQGYQAEELMQVIASAGMPVIIGGDLNSDADGSTTATYQTLVASGLQDAWAAARPGEAGPTCCQVATLTNDPGQLDRRIDYILVSGEFEVLFADRVGDGSDDRTAGGLWPSDHASVIATLRLP